MNNNPVTLPVYVKLSLTIMGVLSLFYILYIGQDLIIPIVFSLILAILLNPVVNFFVRLRMNRAFAILLSISITIILASGILYFIGSQLSNLSESMPLFRDKFNIMLNDIFDFLQRRFNVNHRQVDEWIAKLKGTGMSNAVPFLHNTISTLSSVLVVMFLLPVYIFMFLLYKPLLLEFISRLFKGSNQGRVSEILNQTKGLIQNYLVGLLTECGLVALLNSISLLIIGIDYAILLGVIGALLNIIPYVGGLVAILLPVFMALATKSVTSAVLVFVAYIIVQFIDNNIIVPRVVASKVKINALMSIIVVLLGGALWGISGMFLSIPLTAIVKVVFDHVPNLMPFGYLLGDEMPPSPKTLIKDKVKPAANNH